jgi:hypothetical protein
VSAASETLKDLANLTREEFHAWMTSGAFTGFTKEDMAEADETDRGKMEAFNECLRLMAYARQIEERRRNSGQ